MADQQTLFPLPAPRPKVSRRKPATLNRIKVDHELAKDRYYLHRRVKKYFPIDGAKRIVDISPYQSLEELPKYPLKYVTGLIELGYNIQISIPCPPQKKAQPQTFTTPSGKTYLLYIAGGSLPTTGYS